MVWVVGKGSKIGDNGCLAASERKPMAWMTIHKWLWHSLHYLQLPQLSCQLFLVLSNGLSALYLHKGHLPTFGFWLNWHLIFWKWAFCAIWQSSAIILCWVNGESQWKNGGKVNYACYLKWGQKLLYCLPLPLKSLFEWRINNVRFRSYVFLQHILNRRYRVCEAGQKVGKSKLHNTKVQLCHLSIFLLKDSFGADQFVNKTGNAKI